MKTRTLTLMMLVAFATTVAALPPLGLQERVAEQRLEEILRTWEGLRYTLKNLRVRYVATIRHHRGVQSYHCEHLVVRLPEGRFGYQTTAYEVNSWGWKSHQPEISVITADRLYLTHAGAKELWIQKLHPVKGDLPVEALQCWWASLVDAAPFAYLLQDHSRSLAEYRLQMHLDQHYAYLSARSSGQWDFRSARVTFANRDWPQLPKNMPRQFYWVRTDGCEVTWDIRHLAVNSSELAPENLRQPDVPADWKQRVFEAGEWLPLDMKMPPPPKIPPPPWANER